MIDLTQEQWSKVDAKAKKLAKEYAEGFSEDKFGKGEIYKALDGGYEQREYGGSYYILISELEEIIADVVNVDDIDGQDVEHFYDFVIDFENWLSEMLPNEWFAYFEDGDIWVARYWDDKDEIPEDLQHLIFD